MATRALRLGLFFTRDVSLQVWQRVGSLDRELALYRALAERGVRTTLFPYQGDDNGAVPGVEFQSVEFRSAWLQHSWNRLHPGYRRMMAALDEVELIKTNQFTGAEEALLAAGRRGLPVLARGGYLPSRFAKWGGKTEADLARIEAEESLLMSEAQRVVVTTESMRAELRRKYPDLADKVRVIGNYVTEAFNAGVAPAPKAEGEFRVVTVGRHHPQKGYDLLIEALRGLPVRWRCIGSGADLPATRELAAKAGVVAEFVERVATADMPSEYRAADVFVLSSRYEGHPKVLLEAMACGCPCVVTNGPGVGDEIENGVNGLVTPLDADALRAAVERMRGDQAEAARFGAAAADTVRRKYRLDVIADAEAALYRDLLDGEKGMRA